MRAGLLAILTLNAVSAVVGAPAPDATADVEAPEATQGLDELADLAAAALEKAEDLAQTKKRGSTCNWSNVRIRREW